MARIDKLTRLLAVFDQFHDSIAAIAEPIARRLVGNWATVRSNYTETSGIPRGALASGMEQGLRELPMLLASMPEESRKVAATALGHAIAMHYPEFVAKDAERLDKLQTRGSIRSESEYYLVRHRIDVIEGQAGLEDELRSLYKLVGHFESRAR